jgi:PPOX class probable F420-dependent enzyme
VELSRDAIERLLDTWPVARLATLRADGAASLVPVVFVRSAGRIWLPVDDKPKRASATRELARVENIRRDPRVSLLLDQYEADWTALWWLRADGEAQVVGQGAPGFEAAAEALRKKYPQYRETALFRAGSAPALLALEPKRITSWAASAELVEFLS